jgi:prophage antirepressor-like protein
MSNIIPFSFENHSVRVLADDNGEPLFVARDVAAALGYANTNDAISTHCRGVAERYPIVDSLGRNQEARVIREPDLYRMMANSQLPTAQEFEKLVFEEILPTVRKTGGYQAKPTGEVRPLIDANRLFRSNLSIAKLVFDGNQALLSANQATYKTTGTDVLGNLGATHLIAKERDALLTATDIGERLGLSGQKVNLMLEEKGLVLSFRDHKNRKQYEMTEDGAKLGEALDTGKKHGDGTPVKQIKWYSRIVDLLKGEQAA